METKIQFYTSNMPITGFNKITGSWGMYCKQIRNHWFGIKGLFGFRYFKTWGYDY